MMAINIGVNAGRVRAAGRCCIADDAGLQCIWL
jgi:hypothetical protein